MNLVNQIVDKHLVLANGDFDVVRHVVRSLFIFIFFYSFQIIPVEGHQKVNGEPQKSCGEVLHEIIISKYVFTSVSPQVLFGFQWVKLFER